MLRRIKSTTVRLFAQQLFQAKNPTKISALWPVDFPYKEPVKRKTFPCHDVIMLICFVDCTLNWLKIKFSPWISFEHGPYWPTTKDNSHESRNISSRYRNFPMCGNRHWIIHICIRVLRKIYFFSQARHNITSVLVHKLDVRLYTIFILLIHHISLDSALSNVYIYLT